MSKEVVIEETQVATRPSSGEKRPPRKEKQAEQVQKTPKKGERLSLRELWRAVSTAFWYG